MTVMAHGRYMEVAAKAAKAVKVAKVVRADKAARQTATHVITTKDLLTMQTSSPMHPLSSTTV